jgi:3-oxoacyl-[acyl-carrier protein] reductase
MTHARLGPASGSRCIVIGGCGGIGRAYVDGLIAADCRVAVLDLAKSLEVAPLPNNVLGFATDAADPAALRVAFDRALTALGGLDVLGYVAGINPKQVCIADIDFADYERIMAINLRSALLAAQLSLPPMHAAGAGAMVFVSSGLALNPEPSFGSYSISKAGLIALAKTIAKENAPAIRANVVAPGVVDTAFLSGGTGSGGEKGRPGYFAELGELGQRILASIPIGRMAVADDVAGPMLFLTGPASAYMTGQVLHINGGRLMP